MTKFESLITQQQFDDAANELYGIDANCEGNVEQRFLAGWENAADIRDSRGGIITDDEFKYFCLSEIRNM